MKFSTGQQESAQRLIAVTILLSFLFTPTVAAQADPPGSANPESFPWLIIPILLVFLAAFFFWFGHWIYGRKGCAVGAIRKRTFVGVVFPPTTENPASYEQTGKALKALRAFPWITIDVPVSVLGPEVPTVVERKEHSERVQSQINKISSEVEKNRQTDFGVDIVAKLTDEIGTPSLLSGNYWKKQTQLIRLIPENADESHPGESGKGGWNPALVQDPAWLAKKLPPIVDTALKLCGEGAKEGRL